MQSENKHVRGELREFKFTLKGREIVISNAGRFEDGKLTQSGGDIRRMIAVAKREVLNGYRSASVA